MSKAIKPQQGVVYECYKGYTDSGNDRVRTGQKFVWDGDDNGSQYVLNKASGRGMSVLVPKDKFASYFCPAAEQPLQTKCKTFKVGDKVLISDDSQYYGITISNPANVEGVITRIMDESLGIIVKWNNDTENSYNTRDLLLVTGKAKSKSYIDGVENKDSNQLKLKNMNINLSAIAITDLEQIKAIAELIPSVKEQIMAQYPELFETETKSKHKVGNRYEHSDGNTYLLVGEHSHVALANINTGMIESRTIPVDDYNNITEDEFEGLCDDTEELELIEY